MPSRKKTTTSTGLNAFTAQVIHHIQSIPRGRVATYGQIAALSGKPHGSRGVAWILRSCSRIYKLPWHRVLGSQAKISFARDSHNYRKQKKLLEDEGVIFSMAGLVDFKKFQWKKKPKKRSSSSRTPKMFS